MNSKILTKIIIGCFIAVPILSSVISTLHIIDLFQLGNPSWISVALAIAIEIGSIASFLTLSILSKLNKTIVWSMFGILFFMQLLGNMYYSYEWMTNKILTNPIWLDSFKQMTEFFTGTLKMVDVKMYLTIIISWPIPLISVFLLKSAVDYLGDDVNEVLEEKIKEEDTQAKEVSFYDLKAEDRENFRKKFLTSEEEK